MHLDVTEYRKFYDSPLGHVAIRMIRKRMRTLWPDTKGQSILGLGYATPYLGPFRSDAGRVVALMPAAQGVAAWPRSGRGLVALADEEHLPLEDAAFDRVILVHALENTEMLRALLRQSWRVLAPSGRLMVVAANRASLWAQMENSPFGHGRPFTRPQLERTLTEAMFTPVAWDRALCLPPLRWRWTLRYAQAMEGMGQSLWPRFAGALIVDATKQVYAAMPTGGTRARVRIFAPEAQGARALTTPLPAEQHDRTLGGKIVPAARIGERYGVPVFPERQSALDPHIHLPGQRHEVGDAAQVDVRRLVPSV
jgi:SAM-dependent methyltransferase